MEKIDNNEVRTTILHNVERIVKDYIEESMPQHVGEEIVIRDCKVIINPTDTCYSIYATLGSYKDFNLWIKYDIYNYIKETEIRAKKQY